MQQSLFEEPTEILLSLADEYWKLILAGEKRYEYRRVFRRDRTRAFVITTGPLAALVGYMELGEPIIAAPDVIYGLAESARPGNGQAVLDYMSGLSEGFAVPISGVYVGVSVRVDDLRKFVPKITIPQSYFLVDRNLLFRDFVHEWMNECRKVEQ